MRAELLAPAGSYEAMTAAYLAGADAVYIGGEKFGARAYADNLDSVHMLGAIDYAHLHGKQLYLTVNTMLKESELENELYEYLLPYYKRGLDAVIVQDSGVFSFIKKEFPGLPIHCSTQMTITGAAGARLLEQLGASRIVTARELSLQEIQDIRKQTELEIESFVHGALCYCYSGQCLFSSMLGGRSGNRGKCAQPCRLPYQVNEGRITLNDEKTAYVLSPKDMCTIDLLPEILEAGVTSLKIEGRMKKPEYTAGVVRIYRKYLDLATEGETYEVAREDRQELFDLYNRDGFHQGYYRQRNGRRMMALRNEKTLKKKDGQVRNEALFERISQEYVKPEDQIKVRAEVSLKAGEKSRIRLSACGHEAVCQGADVQRAVKQPLSKERVERQLRKTGATLFHIEALSLEMTDDIFMPMQDLNELRRGALASLEQEILKKFFREEFRSLNESDKTVKNSHKETDIPVWASAETKEQISALLNSGAVKRIYALCSVFYGKRFLENVGMYVKECTRQGIEPFLMLPYMLREEKTEELFAYLSELKLTGIRGFLVHNLEQYARMREAGMQECTVQNASMSAWNHRGKLLFDQLGMEGDTVPAELNSKEIKKRCNTDSEMVVYGYTVLMISAQCVKKNLDACRKEDSVLYLRDRYKKQFAVKCDCSFCYNTIYNSIPTGLLREYQEVKELGVRAVRLNFTIEDSKRTAAIARLFSEAYGMGKLPQYSGEFTKGHFRRGV
ncbi:U32 family peptidase [Ruminococcus sp. OA3]|uniref:U32 family peptidase n=1 Tax=Ruminococcus sp. OA3 TaxID=2914164 RepID=UPI001F061A5F|nr:U32 family peptidase [Ruminococcus sp. OA3]MCH1983578.1 U32 family peptidase [Ruminococcus sp. OA3]